MIQVPEQYRDKSRVTTGNEQGALHAARRLEGTTVHHGSTIMHRGTRNRGTLVVRCEKARNLVEPAGWVGAMKPHVRISLGNQKRVTNPPRMSGTDPVYAEEFIFPLEENRAVAAREELLVHVFTEAESAVGAHHTWQAKGAFVGSGAVNLTGIVDAQGSQEGWCELR